VRPVWVSEKDAPVKENKVENDINLFDILPLLLPEKRHENGEMNMICPRCGSDAAGLLVKAPVDDAWEVYVCGTCSFAWRSTESEDITDPARYDRRFKIDPDSIPSMPVIPPVPKLTK